MNARFSILLVIAIATGCVQQSKVTTTLNEVDHLTTEAKEMSLGYGHGDGSWIVTSVNMTDHCIVGIRNKRGYTRELHINPAHEFYAEYSALKPADTVLLRYSASAVMEPTRFLSDFSDYLAPDGEHFRKWHKNGGY